MTEHASPTAVIRDFLRRHGGIDDLDDDVDYFADGLVDSLFALELVTFLESTFDIVIESEDLDLENFRTVTGVGAFVGRKVNGVHAG